MGERGRQRRTTTGRHTLKRIFSAVVLVAATATAGGAAAASITFYQDDNFRGNHLRADRPMSNLSASNFNDSVRSAVVHDGRWEICVNADFTGGCSVLEPGAYPTLGAYAGRISSLRPISAGYVSNNNSGNYGNANSSYSNNNGSGRQGPSSRGRNAGATLYEGANLSGRSYALEDAMTNMASSGFNDRASSLHVDSGYWIFCSDSEFRGDCRTFGPGDYPTLPALNNAISSGRRITNDYPYNDKPDWQRGTYNPLPNSSGK